MSVVLESEFSHTVSSSSGNLDSNTTLSADNSRLTVRLDTPINFSSSSIQTTVEVQSASVWNTSYNISAALLNNQFNYKIATVAQPAITIPDGLYSVTTLNAEVQRQIVNAGNPSTTVAMSGNSSTQKVVLSFDIGAQVDFAFANSVGDTVLGFTNTVFPAAPATIAGQTETGSSIAAFNNTNTFNIISNIVSDGIKINNVAKGLIANIPITAPVGSIVNYQPVNPLRATLNERRGKPLQQFYIQIADDDGNPLPQNEDWVIILTFRQRILLSDKTVPILDLFH